MSRLGAGIIGAGLVAQAIHLPALATLADRFRVVHVMDVGGRIAGRAGARFSATAAGGLDLAGHTAGQQGLRMPAATRQVVLASDAAHYIQKIKGDWPFHIAERLPDMYAAHDRLRAMQAAGHVVVPGPAAEVFTGFPARRFGDGGVLVRLG
jgi:hypothetical protein